MIVETAIFICNICGERSSDICVACTKDTCANHRCDRCKRCSDCCECEMPLSASQVVPEAEVEPEPLPIQPELVEPDSQPDVVVAEVMPETEPEQMIVPDIPELFRPDPPRRPEPKGPEDPQPE